MSVFLTAKGQVLTCGIQDLTALSETECKLNRPCPVQGLDDIVDISVGAEHVLVLNKKGQVYGWGNNFSSQLGLDPDVHGDLVTKPNLIPGNYFVFFKAKIIYRTRAIISRGLYIFYPISKDNSCSVTFGLMYGLYSRAASNQERPMMARIRYIFYIR